MIEPKEDNQFYYAVFGYFVFWGTIIYLLYKGITTL